MIIYRVKLKVHKDTEAGWYEWMSKTHIPDVINTRHFIDYSFVRLIANGQMDELYTTYEIQYLCKSQEELEKYEALEAKALREEHIDKFGSAIKDIQRSVFVDVSEMELVS